MATSTWRLFSVCCRHYGFRVCIVGFVKKISVGRLLLMLLGIGYGTLALAVFVVICVHYAMPLEQAFDLCYRELIWLARTFHTTYNIVNYVIFILAFLVVTTVNLLAALVLRFLR